MALAAVEGEVRPEWLDAEQRMTSASLALAFAAADAAALEALQLARAYRLASGCSLLLTEAKYICRSVLRPGEGFRIATWLAGADARRLSLTHRMIRDDGATAAEAEVLFLHVDRSGRRAVSFPSQIRARLNEAAALAHLRSPAA